MKNKKLAVLGVTLGLSVLSAMPAFASGLCLDGMGWKYANADGSFVTSAWKWLDGNNDGMAECYYFGADGVLYVNTTTPDGYTVNESGAWTENGVVQSKQVGDTTPYVNPEFEQMKAELFSEMNRKLAEGWWSPSGSEYSRTAGLVCRSIVFDKNNKEEYDKYVSMAFQIGSQIEDYLKSTYGWEVEDEYINFIVSSSGSLNSSNGVMIDLNIKLK